MARITPGDLGLWNDETEAALRSVLEDIHVWSPMPLGIQLGHEGRKASCAAPWLGGEQLEQDAGGWQTVAPSAVAFNEGERPPVVLSRDDLARIKQAFVDSARRAEKLGIELIELHAAHGYLLHQFLSPFSNHREDEYGGSLENRMRFPLEIFHAVREAVSEKITVGVRISATDWVEGSWDNAQSIAAAGGKRATTIFTFPAVALRLSSQSPSDRATSCGLRAIFARPSRFRSLRSA
nr:NADPH dehydrogenase [Candidatus Pantoea persica]